MSGQFGILNKFSKWKKGDLVGDPWVSICLNSCGHDDGNVPISSTLINESEIYYAIDRLKNDLESVRKEAKRVLKSQQKKMGCPDR